MSNKISSLMILLFWTGLLLSSIWIFIGTGSELKKYLEHNLITSAEIEKWTIESTQGGSFVNRAHYRYHNQGNTYFAVHTFGPSYLNPWAAEYAEKPSHTCCWMNGAHPERSILERKFPIKKTLSSLLLITLILYFFILHRQVTHAK